MQEKGFWDDIKRAEDVTKESKSIKDKIDRYESLVSRLDDVEILAELAEEDEETVNEVIREIRDIEKLVEEYKIELLLSGEYDRNDAILNLHAGVGGSDANDWTLMLLRMYTRWCEKKGYKVETLDILEGDEAGTNSATASISVFYIEGEAEESGASSGSSSQTENSGNSSSENENNGNSDGNTSSGNENNDSSSEEEWTLIKESIDYTGNGSLIQIIKNTDISTQQISKLKITLTNYTKQDDDWITASADETWINKSENIQNYPDNYEISDTDFISEFLTNGLYIGSTSKLTCKISIYYK